MSKGMILHKGLVVGGAQKGSAGLGAFVPSGGFNGGNAIAPEPPPPGGVDPVTALRALVNGLPDSPEKTSMLNYLAGATPQQAPPPPQGFSTGATAAIAGGAALVGGVFGAMLMRARK